MLKIGVDINRNGGGKFYVTQIGSKTTRILMFYENSHKHRFMLSHCIGLINHNESAMIVQGPNLVRTVDCRRILSYDKMHKLIIRLKRIVKYANQM